ncbi:hypothetical protein M427DRAFT_288849 [Gonapodya prolifera JEL478]|uniref:Uncharacterized protein n=1 Tax=Gonapodya prolifera (strain JEL478) TaxID=1344416 RepID=A0A139AIU9_GONPJ|nr:hypothetical protein M427DRAFT_288849 [Gonapodya prolifera JEL478]|eukprot:KXS16658.1 hypothetical protein M427DRAFT_288849 [Gonapodya prolifera JEL478]
MDSRDRTLAFFAMLALLRSPIDPPAVVTDRCESNTAAASGPIPPLVAPAPTLGEPTIPPVYPSALLLLLHMSSLRISSAAEATSTSSEAELLPHRLPLNPTSDSTVPVSLKHNRTDSRMSVSTLVDPTEGDAVTPWVSPPRVASPSRDLTATTSAAEAYISQLPASKSPSPLVFGEVGPLEALANLSVMVLEARQASSDPPAGVDSSSRAAHFREVYRSATDSHRKARRAHPYPYPRAGASC